MKTIIRKLVNKPYVKDILLCALLMAVFAAVAFYNLGDVNYPQTEYFAGTEPVTVDFGEPVDLQYVIYMYGGKLDTGFRLHSWDGVGDVELQYEERNNARFHWMGYPFQAVTRYAVFEPNAPGVSILEIGFYDENGLVAPVDYTEGAEFMFDEQYLLPEKNPSYFDDIIFDEIFYATTAYDFMHGFPPFEWTHPPLGKSIIALGIKTLGMTPFGWRFMSALFGVLMIIPIYALGRRLFESRWLAFIAAFAFTFDFMHFVQARIGTIDIFLVTFITFMYLFMYEYIRGKPENRLSTKSLINLGLSGVFMGLAMSVKWSAAFAVIGVLVLFALSWFDTLSHYSDPDNEGSFSKDWVRTMMYGVLFFIAVPAVIYLLSFIPYARATGLSWPGGIIKEQKYMLDFHMNMAEDNDFQSSWWTWPLNLKPINYYRYIVGEREHMGVHTFGNPALWWGGLLALVWATKRWIADKDRTARFLCIAWVSQILPWALVSRSSYIYHYFPCVPFLALTAAYFIKTREKKQKVWYALGFCALVLVMFVMFYPVLSGVFTADQDYVTWLQWLPGWEFMGA